MLSIRDAQNGEEVFVRIYRTNFGLLHLVYQTAERNACENIVVLLLNLCFVGFRWAFSESEPVLLLPVD